MSQQNNTVNVLIKNANGKQEFIKVKPQNIVQAANIKLDGNPNFSQRIIQQRYVNIPGAKILMAQSSPSKYNAGVIGTVGGSIAGGVATGVSLTGGKTVRLTPTKIGTLKIMNSQQAPGTISQMKQGNSSTNGNCSSSSTSNISNQQSSTSSATLPTKSNQSYVIGAKRTNTSAVSTTQSNSKRRKSDKVGKGLRHFSMKVCEKVKEKRTTTYNVVADELVAEETDGDPNKDPASYDQKNIRRRVYDALNVLMAMDIISKEKKEIRWKGLPTSTIEECNELEKENEKSRERIDAKLQELRKLLLQQVSIQSLVKRNKEMEQRGLIPNHCSAIQLPFIIINTQKQTYVNCSISSDKTEYSFKFDNKFEIQDDVEVLKRMGLLYGLDKGECTPEDIERVKSLVPKTFEKYIEIYGQGQMDAFFEDASSSSGAITYNVKDDFDESEIIEEDILSDDGDDNDDDEDADDSIMC